MGDKTILFLGGSTQQVPVIEMARQMGYRTILIDYLPDNPGRLVADRWYCESTTDIESVYRIARDEKVCGILPYASDPAALPAAIVCEMLGLPTNPSKSVEILGIKHLFRRFLRENGFASPSTYSFNVSTSLPEILSGIAELRFPVVVKPTDSSGSKGVSFLEVPAGLEAAVKHAAHYSRNGVLLIEEFIDRGYPYVIGGDIFVEDGIVTLWGDMECLRDDGGRSLIPIGEKWPNGLNISQRSALHNELQRLIDTLGIHNGELNIEVLIGSDDEPHFLEVGPRAGGNMIPIQLSDAFDVDLVRANILACVGECPRLEPVETKECFMTYVLHSHCDGVLEGIKYSDEVAGHIYRKVMYKSPGDYVESFDGAGKALGIIFMKFSSMAEMNIYERDIESHIKVVIK